MTETLSIKISKETKARLKAVATRRRTTPSCLLRHALENVLAENPQVSFSLYDRCRDLLENLPGSGKHDLATNKKHMKDFGRSRRP